MAKSKKQKAKIKTKKSAALETLAKAAGERLVTGVKERLSKKGKGKGKGKKKGDGTKKPRSAKLLLKKAYEKRAKFKIRQGNLGGARRDLRKKMTVV